MKAAERESGGGRGLHFTIDGEWLTDFARTRVIEGDEPHARRILACVVPEEGEEAGLSAEAVAGDVLAGNKRFTSAPDGEGVLLELETPARRAEWEARLLGRFGDRYRLGSDPLGPRRAPAWWRPVGIFRLTPTFRRRALAVAAGGARLARGMIKTGEEVLSEARGCEVMLRWEELGPDLDAGISGAAGASALVIYEREEPPPAWFAHRLFDRVPAPEELKRLPVLCYHDDDGVVPWSEEAEGRVPYFAARGLEAAGDPYDSNKGIDRIVSRAARDLAGGRALARLGEEEADDGIARLEQAAREARTIQALAVAAARRAAEGRVKVREIAAAHPLGFWRLPLAPAGREAEAFGYRGEVEIPAAAFIRWSLRSEPRPDFDLPEWEAVSVPGMKRYQVDSTDHTDTFLGLLVHLEGEAEPIALGLDEAYPAPDSMIDAREARLGADHPEVRRERLAQAVDRAIWRARMMVGACAREGRLPDLAEIASGEAFPDREALSAPAAPGAPIELPCVVLCGAEGGRRSGRAEHAVKGEPVAVGRVAILVDGSEDFEAALLGAGVGITARGGAVCHLASVARGEGILLVRVEGAAEKIPAGAMVEIDPKAGRIKVTPQEVRT